VDGVLFFYSLGELLTAVFFFKLIITMLKYHEDIIAAIATALGNGAITIVRVSGKGSIETIDKIFSGKNKLVSANSHTLHYGNIINNDREVIDEVLVTVLRHPHTYTTEDMVEINCHGGWFVTNRILQTILQTGGRLAEPGEFTKRAFLNGRIDLAQAEAVADMIQARSDLALKSSLLQLEGKLSQKIININTQLINIISLLELELDFVEENIVLTDYQSILGKLSNLKAEIEKLINSFKIGKLYREGVKIVIAGLPNVGKSSLLNLLLEENRAIVTPLPGTTRDIIEENFVINGALFKLIDTAGLRLTDDIIESEGIKRSYDNIKNADIILYIVDSSATNFEEDIRFIQKMMGKNGHILIILNKIDLISDDLVQNNPIRKQFRNPNISEISALTGTGLGDLKESIFNAAFLERIIPSEASILITNERHKQALVEALKNLDLAINSVINKMSNEFISLDMRLCLDSLGTIIGKSTTDDILNNIFSKFCIGK
jgi:tRNA modification GTPase